MARGIPPIRNGIASSSCGEHPKVQTSIRVEHTVRGNALNPESVRRAVELSATRYCSAAAMLGRVAHIDETCRVVDEATGHEHAGTHAVGP